MPRIAKEKKVENDKIDKIKNEKDKKVTKKTVKPAVTSSIEKSSKNEAKSNSKITTKSASKKNTKSAPKQVSKSTTNVTKKRTKTSKTKKEKNIESSIQIIEYYDLPYKYGNTIVKLLAQTPKTLFVYWEIADDDIANFKKQYGENFLEITKPILIVHNLTLNKTHEVEINDFANCWYLNTDDSDCKFDIELARKFITSNKKTSESLYIAKSNDLQSPNDHILFEKLTDTVVFRNSKTNEKIEEHIDSFKFLKDIYKFYQDMYTDELLKNPSSKF